MDNHGPHASGAGAGSQTPATGIGRQNGESFAGRKIFAAEARIYTWAVGARQKIDNGADFVPGSVRVVVATGRAASPAAPAAGWPAKTLKGFGRLSARSRSGIPNGDRAKDVRRRSRAAKTGKSFGPGRNLLTAAERTARPPRAAPKVPVFWRRCGIPIGDRTSFRSGMLEQVQTHSPENLGKIARSVPLLRGGPTRPVAGAQKSTPPSGFFPGTAPNTYGGRTNGRPPAVLKNAPVFWPVTDCHPTDPQVEKEMKQAASAPPAAFMVAPPIAEKAVKYQTYTITKDPESVHYATYRIFSLPVHHVDGRWVPAGEAFEETHLWPAFDVAFEVDSDRIHGQRDNPGPLDDIPAPPGWTVVRRAWLPDNYVPPSAEVREEGERRARAYLKEMLGDEWTRT
jgi:hypothetical protein